MLRFILKDETRFWRIFLRLLVPIGVFSLIPFGVAWFATLTGKTVVRFLDQPLSPIWGFVAYVVALPICVFVWTLLVTVIVFFRLKSRSSKSHLT
jgi:hypothetical protein